MAEFGSPIEPSAKRSKGDAAADWDSKWQKADNEYDEARKAHDDIRKKLEEAYRARSQNAEYIQFLNNAMRDLQQRMQDAHKVKELLLQAQSQSSQASQCANLFCLFSVLGFPFPLIPTT